MICCNSSVNIGCFDYCSEIATGFNATQNGDHIITLYFVNSTAQTITLNLTIGEQIIIPPSSLNEAKDHELKIIQPDGQLYEFEPGVFCLSLSTYVAVTV